MGVINMPALYRVNTPALMLAMLVFAVSMPTSAAVTVYLQLEDIQGDVVAAGYENQIQVLEWNWSLGRAASSITSRTKTSSGTVSVQDLSVTTFNSKATPKLIEGVTTAKIYPRAVLTLVNPATGVRVEQLELTNVGVTSVETGVSAGAERPVSTVTLSFTKFVYTYTQVGSDGTVKGNVQTQYDIASGSAN